VGGGLAGVNYRISAAKDDMQRQQLDYARQQVEKLQEVIETLEGQQEQISSYDGTFN
jgi:hypothetical protein